MARPPQLAVGQGAGRGTIAGMRRCWLVLVILVCGSRAHAAPLGQWVWSRADVAPLSAARTLRPDVAAAVHVAELRFEQGAPRTRLRLSPNTVSAAQVAVIRFDASFHAAWSVPPAELQGSVSAALARVLSVVGGTAPPGKLFQID